MSQCMQRRETPLWKHLGASKVSQGHKVGRKHTSFAHVDFYLSKMHNAKSLSLVATARPQLILQIL